MVTKVVSIFQDVQICKNGTIVFVSFCPEEVRVKPIVVVVDG